MVKRVLFLLNIVLSLLFISFTYAQEDNGPSEREKIEHLLKFIEKSDAIFIRNGDKHNSKKARQHIEGKYRWVTRKFFFMGPYNAISARLFIEKLASSSSTSGKDYEVILPGTKKPIPTGPWLLKELERYEKSYKK